jgi:hypothetical protein
VGGQPTRQDGAAGAIRFLKASRFNPAAPPASRRRTASTRVSLTALGTALSGSVGPRQVTLDELDDLVRLRLRDAAAALLPTWLWVVIELQGEHGEELGAEDAGDLPILEQSVAPAGALRRAAGPTGRPPR